MASTRIKKIGGNYKNTHFNKVLKQLNGRALLVVVVINSNCEECSKLLKNIQQLESGFIDRLQQLVLFYGFSDAQLEETGEAVTKLSEKSPKEEKKKKELITDEKEQ